MYKVGDYITIRQWEDMEKEYGLDSWGYIKARIVFTTTMQKYCGKKMRIVSIDCGIYDLLDAEGWTFTEDMFEKQPIFTIKDIKTGMFGEDNDGEVFVVVEGRLIYQNEGYNNIEEIYLNDGHIVRLTDKAVSFKQYKILSDKDFCYIRQPKKITRAELEKLVGGKFEIVD